MTSLFSPEVINALKTAVNCIQGFFFLAQGGMLLCTIFNGLIHFISALPSGCARFFNVCVG